MDIQSILTQTIEVIVMSFVTLMIFDLVGGLWVVPLPPAGWQPPVIEQSTERGVATRLTLQENIPHVTPLALQFEQIPDPWSLEAAPVNPVFAQSVIISFPTLRLLPPTQEVQISKPKRTRAKSSTPPKSASTSTKRQPTKSRKITA